MNESDLLQALARGEDSRHIRLHGWMDEQALALRPDVPSFKELGVPITYSQWSGIFVPAGTPPDAVAKLREAARAATRDERTIQVMTTAGTSFQFQDAPEFDRFVKDDASTMLKVVKQIGRVN
mgnify:CR=1 FL=1